MKGSRFSDSRNPFLWKQAANRIPVADFCGKAEIWQATYF